MSVTTPRAPGFEKLSSQLLALTLFLLPWVGVGLAQLLLHRAFGTGVQPALLSGGLLLLAVLGLGRISFDADAETLLAALAWTLLGSAAIWSLDDIGLAGEAPWSKTLKQCVQLVYFVALATVPSLLLLRAENVMARLRSWERALSAGLLIACLVGLYLAAAFYAELPLEKGLLNALGSNPSIAAGSDELFLGDSFVGIPRVRSGAAEPLYFGSYLLFAIPVCAMGWLGARGGGRWWRGFAIILGLACLVLTFSRGVYLGLMLQLMLLFLGVWRGVLPRPSRRTVTVSLVTLVLASGLLAAVFTGGAPWKLPLLLWKRMAQSLAEQDLSNLTRMSSWRAAWLIYLRHPLGGVGWGGFGFWFFRAGLVDAGAAIFGWPVTNSVPLRVLAETGSVGGVLWLLCLRRPLAPLWGLKEGRGAPSDLGLVAFVLSTCVAGMLLQMLTFSQLNLPHLWLCLGLSAALSRTAQRERVA